MVGQIQIKAGSATAHGTLLGYGDTNIIKKVDKIMAAVCDVNHSLLVAALVEGKASRDLPDSITDDLDLSNTSTVSDTKQVSSDTAHEQEGQELPMPEDKTK